jgi:UDP-glucose 4-epimerase
MSRPITRCLVLGHDGFIGSHFCRMLAGRHPEIAVAGISRDQLDLSEPDAADRIAEHLGPGSALMMLAAVKRQVGDNPDAYLRNTALCTTVAKAFAANPGERLLFVSSAAVYGEDIEGAGITEESPVHPRSYYGLAKISGEMLFRLACGDAHADRLLSVRPATIFGPGESAQAYGPSGFLAKALGGEEITLWGDGSELREFVDIADACEIFLRLLLGTQSGVLNLVSGRSISFRDILAEIAAVLGAPPKIREKPRNKAKVDHRFDNSRLLSAVGGFAFKPMRTSLEEIRSALAGR